MNIDEYEPPWDIKFLSLENEFHVSVSKKKQEYSIGM